VKEITVRALRLVRSLPLLVLALAVPAGLVACSDGSSPTEPAPAVSAAPATAAAAPVVVAENGTAPRGGARALRQEAMGGEAPRRAAAGEPAVRVAAVPASPVVGVPEAARGGNGKGKGGAKPKPEKPAKPEKPEKPAKPGRPGGDLRVEIQPDVWNTNWVRSNGTVTALIRGSNLGDVDLDSIVLVGTDGAAEALEPLRVGRQGNHIRAFFAKDDAFETLDTPAPGETHEIVIRLTIEGVADAPDVEKELKDTIRVVGPAG
jgi:hypothetical protein